MAKVLPRILKILVGISAVWTAYMLFTAPAMIVTGMVNAIAAYLTVIGGLNWLVIGLMGEKYDLVEKLGFF